jgi:hypothetical protein
MAPFVEPSGRPAPVVLARLSEAGTHLASSAEPCADCGDTAGWGTPAPLIAWTPTTQFAHTEGRAIRGLIVEQHLARLREGLIPLAERCGRVMREALAALEALHAAPSRAVERSAPIMISVSFR